MLTPGQRIGAYEVGAHLGSGGMGMVYRAHDRRLGRDVALKILPAEFSERPDRVARFGREARLLASLSHPHIAAIYGFEEYGDVRALVLELVEGQTLAERLSGGAIPVREAIAIAQQIAEAVDAAHEKGIIHRDLKPANIKLTPDGIVKVLDFGLAKAFGPLSLSEPILPDATTEEKTMAGVVLGTAGYMSPEQARGEVADKRTDIWAFGCVLYEMLTGRRAFSGATASDILVALLEKEPDWSALPSATPQPVRTLLHRCLEKDRKRRLRDIGDAVLELEAASAPSTNAAEATVTLPRSRRWQTAAVGAAILALSITGAAWLWLTSAPRVAPGMVRMSATLPPGIAVTEGPGYTTALALSPDGRTLVMAGMGEKGLHLYQRPLDQFEATPLAGTAGGSNPFFSPDGNWIGFFAEGRMRRIPAGGGTAVDIAEVPGHTMGASWGPDDRIVFVPGPGSPLLAVNMHGGTVESLTEIEDDEDGHHNPEVSRDGRVVLFDDGRWIHALDRVSGRRKRLIKGNVANSAIPGYLLFCRGTTLLAAAFDVNRMEITSPAVPVVDGISRLAGLSSDSYDVSRTGTLAYVPIAGAHSLVLVRPDGIEGVLDEERPSLENPQFSPDGRRIAVAARRRLGERMEVWIHDLGTGGPSRLTSDGGRAPVWTPDGTAVTYSHLGEEQGIYRKPVDGASEAERVVAVREFHWLVGWTPDGSTLAYGEMVGGGNSAIRAFSEGESRYVVEPGNVWGGRLSPDGRWLAYYGMEGGSFEVFVTPFPDGGRQWLVSEGGGRDPSWAPDGTELYYRNGDRLIAARIDTTSGPRALSRRVVLEPFRPPLYDDYDIRSDGTLVIVRPAGDLANQAIVVINWQEDLKRLVSQTSR